MEPAPIIAFCLIMSILICFSLVSNVKYLVDREALVIRIIHNVQIKDNDVQQQREHIFNARCHINNKVCNMIMDSRSCANIASTTLV